MARSTAVSTTDAASQQLATNVMLDDVVADAKAAPDTFSREDVSIPFLRILQDLSPEVKKREPTYVEGAEPGDLLHSVSRKTWKEGVIVVPVVYQRHHIEWRTRESGGGFVKDHGYAPALEKTATRDDKGRDMLPNGNQLVTTALYYLLLLTVEGKKVVAVSEAVLPLKSTQLKKARMWNAMIQSVKVQDPKSGEYVTPKMFYSTFRLSTVSEKNDQGSWYGLKVEPYAVLPDFSNGSDIYLAARHLAGMIEAGERKSDLSQMEVAVPASSDDEDAF